MAALERKDRLIILRGDIRSNRKDTLFLMATPPKLETILDGLDMNHRPLRHVVIAECGRISELGARNQNQGTPWLHANKHVVENLLLHRSVVLHGDPTDRYLPKEENVGRMDAFVAVGCNQMLLSR